MREVLDLDAIAKKWAREILAHSSCLTRQQRLRLHDICRPDRLFFTRSALNHLLELAPFASPSAATFGAEMIRGAIVGRMDSTLPTVGDAYQAEEASNSAANIAQQLFRESRTRANAETVCDAFEWQALATRVAQDSTWRAVQQRPVITYARS